MSEEWRGLQDGSVVFGVSGPADRAEMEAMRYARTYVDEGEVTLQMKKGRRWVTKATMSRSPLALEHGGLEVPG